MSDTVKLIIEIPKVPKNDHERWVLAHGTPLANDSERAEVQAYFDGEAFGWDEGREALIEELKAEIGKYKTRLEMQLSERDTKGKLMISDIFCHIIEILDNIGKAESEDKE